MLKSFLFKLNEKRKLHNFLGSCWISRLFTLTYTSWICFIFVKKISSLILDAKKKYMLLSSFTNTFKFSYQKIIRKIFVLFIKVKILICHIQRENHDNNTYCSFIKTQFSIISLTNYIRMYHSLIIITWRNRRHKMLFVMCKQWTVEM